MATALCYILAKQVKYYPNPVIHVQSKQMIRCAPSILFMLSKHCG